MKQFLFGLMLVIALQPSSRAQECLGTKFRTGQTFEMSVFNAKDKLTGKIAYKVDKVRQDGNKTILDMTAQMQDDKGKTQPPYTISYTCTGTELLADLSGMMQQMQNPGMKDAQLKMKTNQLAYPGKFTVGQKLADGQMEADLINNGSTLAEMNMVLSNRQVEGQQQLTTPAGTFDTYKISSDVKFTSRTMGISIPVTMRMVSYRTGNQILDVRSETYNKNGKLMGYTLLSQAN